MASVLYQIIISLNLMLGQGNYNAIAQNIYSSGSYSVCDGIVIIDTDELARR